MALHAALSENLDASRLCGQPSYELVVEDCAFGTDDQSSHQMTDLLFRRWHAYSRPLEQWNQSSLSFGWKRLAGRNSVRLPGWVLMFLCGVITAMSCVAIFGRQQIDALDELVGRLERPGHSKALPFDFPLRHSQSVLPIACHSHNDYWRRWPLYSALYTGCTSVEADIWLEDDELLVGHARSELRVGKTLYTMYVEPLLGILQTRQMDSVPNEIEWPGIFPRKPYQTLVLVLDFKTKSPNMLARVLEELQPLRTRGWLTFWNGNDRVSRPVTVVASGDAPIDLLLSNTTYRDIFLDAPLHSIVHPEDPVEPFHGSDIGPQSTSALLRYKFNPSNSYYASSSLSRAVGSSFGLPLSQRQLNTVEVQIQQAHQRGLVSRYWSTPSWPRGVRDQTWSLLTRLGVGVLNVDDLRAVRQSSWGRWPIPT